MSKRSSQNAKRFASEIWGAKKDPESGKRKVKARVNEVEREKSLTTKRWKKMCEKFKHSLKDESLEKIDTLKIKFLSIKENTNNLKASQNLTNYMKYCRAFKVNLSLEDYLLKEYYLINYKEKYPEVFEQVVGSSIQKAGEK
jgi:hypothetical protein